jgi:hypothetical protein
LWDVKAVDLAGLKVKGRIAAMRGGMDGSIVRDLLDLAERGDLIASAFGAQTVGVQHG